MDHISHIRKIRTADRLPFMAYLVKGVFLPLLFFQFASGQNGAVAPEDRIYYAIDAFVADPNPENLEKLAANEKTFRPKTRPEWLALVILKCNKAYYQHQFGQSHKAIGSYEEAWQLYVRYRLSGYDIGESCLKPLGNLYTLVGDYENAENVIKQYYYLASLEQDPEQKFAALLNLSNAYHYSGKHGQAITLLHKTISTETLTPTQKGMLWTNLANNYLASGDKKLAIRAYENSIRLLKNTKEEKTLANALRNMALITNDLDLFARARQRLLRTHNTSRELAKLYFDQAFLFDQNGKQEQAQQALHQVFGTLLVGYSPLALPKKESLYAETLLLDALDLQAAIFVSNDQPEKAIESYRLAFHVENLFEALLVYENSKIIHQDKNRSRTEKCLALYYALFRQKKNTRYAEAAFLLAEQTKSAVLMQTVLSSKNRSRDEKRIAAQLRNCAVAILKEQQKGNNADIAKINEAIQKQNRLMLLLKSKTTAPALTNGWSIKDLHVLLEKQNAVMAAYFFGREKLFLFTVDHRKIRLDFLGSSKQLKPQLIRFIGQFSDPGTISDDPLAYNERAHALYKALHLPRKENAPNLVIVPDGLLSFLPFEALVTHKTATPDFAKMNYLLHDFATAYSNSAGFYMNQAPFKQGKASVLGVFPLFENTALELAFSKKELETLKTQFAGKYLSGRQATFANFEAAARNYSVLHLSTHAAAGDVDVPASIRFFDREVLYAELYDLSLQPDLVVLSACETGIGRLYKSEGAMSVARGFQSAGAQNLLFSLWRVNDYTTSACMENFYKNLKDGSAYFEANHRAKLDFLNDKSIPNVKKSPYYWSAFVYYGTLEARDTGYNLTWIWVFLGIFGLLLLWRLPKKRK